jgi:hypothetical protein
LCKSTTEGKSFMFLHAKVSSPLNKLTSGQWERVGIKVQKDYKACSKKDRTF